MQLVIRQSAGENGIFASDAFDSQIGKVVPFNLRDTDDGPIKGTMVVVRLVKADVIEGGHVVELTLESVDEDPRFKIRVSDQHDVLIEVAVPATTIFGEEHHGQKEYP